MKKIPTQLLIILLGVVLFAASGQAPAKPKGILSVLHIDQYINLKDGGSGYEIQVFENVPGLLGHTVVEIASDYLVVEDVAGVTQTRIPIYSIKSVVVTKLPVEK